MKTIKHITTLLLLLGTTLVAEAKTFTECPEAFCKAASGDTLKGNISGRLTFTTQHPSSNTQNSPYPISPILIGAFFEDINYAADGGLYAEMVQNRDFEYCALTMPLPKRGATKRRGARPARWKWRSTRLHPCTPTTVIMPA